MDKSPYLQLLAIQEDNIKEGRKMMKRMKTEKPRQDAGQGREG